MSESPSCANTANHLLAPAGYRAGWEWADQMLLTHKQSRCPGCGDWAIWEPRDGLTRPALYSGTCACGQPFERADPIRADGKGGWLAPCCTTDDMPAEFLGTGEAPRTDQQHPKPATPASTPTTRKDPR